MTKRKIVNPYAECSIGQMSKLVARAEKGDFDPGTEQRIVAMDINERLMELHDQQRDDTMRFTLRGWVGRVQTAAGLQ